MPLFEPFPTPVFVLDSIFDLFDYREIQTAPEDLGGNSAHFASDGNHGAAGGEGYRGGFATGGEFAAGPSGGEFSVSTSDSGLQFFDAKTLADFIARYNRGYMGSSHPHDGNGNDMDED